MTAEEGSINAIPPPLLSAGQSRGSGLSRESVPHPMQTQLAPQPNAISAIQWGSEREQHSIQGDKWRLTLKLVVLDGGTRQ